MVTEKREIVRRAGLIVGLILVVSLLVLVGRATFLPKPVEEKKMPPQRQLLVRSSLPPEQNQIIGLAFERSQGIAVNFIPVAERDIAADKLIASLDGDVLLGTRSILERAARADLLQPVASQQLDMIPDLFCDRQSRWYGVWYDPVVFVVNKELRSAEQIPAGWADLLQVPHLRIVLTDFMAAEAANNLFASFIAVHGETQGMQFFRLLHPKVVQYAKFLGTPVRMVALGEADVGVAVQSEAIRYMEDKFPLRFVYPQEGTAFLLTGAGLLRGTGKEEDAEKFMDWLAREEVQEELQRNRYYFVHTQPEVRKRKQIGGQEIELFEVERLPLLEERTKQLELWIQQVRFQSRGAN